MSENLQNVLAMLGLAATALLLSLTMWVLAQASNVVRRRNATDPDQPEQR